MAKPKRGMNRAKNNLRESANSFTDNIILMLTIHICYVLVLSIMRSIQKSNRLTVWIVSFFLSLFHLPAAPLTWFPGPAMDYPGSAAATVVMPGLGNVVIAGRYRLSRGSERHEQLLDAVGTAVQRQSGARRRGQWRLDHRLRRQRWNQFREHGD